MTINLPIEFGDEIYAIFYDTDNSPKIEHVRVRGVLIDSEGIYVVGRDGCELKLGRDAFMMFDEAAYAAEQILEARKRTRRIPLYDLKED